jgi:hypothetical protein
MPAVVGMVASGAEENKFHVDCFLFFSTRLLRSGLFELPLSADLHLVQAG